MKTTIHTLIISSYLTIAATLTALAQAGELDPTFGTGGKVTTSIGSYDSKIFSIAIQTDGKIVTAGYSFTGFNTDFALARYNSDGSLDSTFGTAGKVTTAIETQDDFGYSVAIQNDGRIVAAGSSSDGYTGNFSLVCYNTDGSLDNTFGSGGKNTTDFGGNNAGRSVVIQADGKIVEAGYSILGPATEFALTRYNSNGTLDYTFDYDGKVTTAIGSLGDAGYSVALQDDGKIVVAGTSFMNQTSGNDFAIVRYNSDGSLDDTFGSNGTVTTAVGLSEEFARSVAIQSDGKILVAGTSQIGNNEAFTLVRYNSDGTLDNGFGNNGKVVTDFGSPANSANSVAIQSDGKIIVAGQEYNGSDFDFGVVRYTSSGSLDNTFGLAGKVTTDFESGTDYGNSVAIQGDGKIVVGGGSDGDFAVARYAVDPVGIAENNFINSFSVYPNPFSNELLVKGTKEREEIIISDVLGKEIIRQKTLNGKTKINTENLLPGFYVLTCFEEIGMVNIKLAKF